MRVGDLVELVSLNPAYKLPRSFIGRRGHVVGLAKDQEVVFIQFLAEYDYFCRTTTVNLFKADLRVITALDQLAEV